MIDPQVLEVMDAVEAFQRGRSDAWSIPREEAMLLHALALAAGSRSIVEVGTSYGFSGLFLAAAARANGGRLHTFEIDPRKRKHASAHFAKAGLSGTITLHAGDAIELLPALPQGVDFAFLDATKSETVGYWEALEPKLAPRCVVTVDNTHTHPKDLGAFLSILRGRSDFTSCDVDVGHGVEVAVRVPPA